MAGWENISSLEAKTVWAFQGSHIRNWVMIWDWPLHIRSSFTSSPMVNFLRIPLHTLAIQIPFRGQPLHLVPIYVFNTVHGAWSNWSNWTECSVTCGVGARSRERYCDNPRPAYGGRTCEGIHKDRKSCSTGEVCVGRGRCMSVYTCMYIEWRECRDDWRNRSNESTQDETTKTITKENKTKRKKRQLIIKAL